MAQIPYADLPQPVDPPLSALGGDSLVELYCGDARCDCNVAALVLGGYPLLVDLGTGRGWSRHCIHRARIWAGGWLRSTDRKRIR